MPEVNVALREHTTSIAFQLTLSKSMIKHLVIIHYFKGNTKLTHHNALRLVTRSFVTTIRCLEERGLIHKAVPVYSKTRRNFGGGPIIESWKPYRMTRAGTLVVNLLKEAGVYQNVVTELKLEKMNLSNLFANEVA